MLSRILSVLAIVMLATPAVAVTTTYTGTVMQNPSGGPSQWGGDPLGIFGGLYLHNKIFSLVMNDSTFVSLTIAGVATTLAPTNLQLPNTIPGQGYFNYTERRRVYCGTSDFDPACFPDWNLPPRRETWVEYTAFTGGWLNIVSATTSVVSAVPVPAGILLLGTALAGLLGWRQLRQPRRSPYHPSPAI